MMQRVALLASLILIVSPPASADDLDAFHLQDPEAWNCAERIAIKPFTLTGKFKGRRSQQEYMRQFAATLSAGMKGRAGIQDVYLVEGAVPADIDALIEGQWRELNTGSRAARFWVGFGAGKARAEVSLVGRSPESKRPWFDVTHARLSPMGLSADEVAENVDEVARDVAAALVTARGACAKEKGQAPQLSTPITSSPSEAVHVVITSEPPGADVYLDSSFVGTAPLPDFRVAPGEHTNCRLSRTFLTTFSGYSTGRSRPNLRFGHLDLRAERGSKVGRAGSRGFLCSPGTGRFTSSEGRPQR